MDRRRPRHFVVAGLLLALPLALGGCGSDDDPQAEPTAPTTTTQATAPPATPRDQAIDDAMKVVTQYNSIRDRIGQDNTYPINSYSAVSTGSDYKLVTEIARRERGTGQRQIGSATVSLIKATNVELKKSATVKLAICQDISKTNVLDRDGKSLVVPNRLERRLAKYTIANPTYKSDPRKGWKVTKSLVTGKDTCDSV